MLETVPRYDPVLTYLNAIMDPPLRLAVKLLMFWTHSLPLMNHCLTFQVYHTDPMESVFGPLLY